MIALAVAIKRALVLLITLRFSLSTMSSSRLSFGVTFVSRGARATGYFLFRLLQNLSVQ